MGLYAQHAYGKSDKITNGIKDNNISGIILSPKAETPSNLEEYVDEMKKYNVEMLLDPQFYLCEFEGAVSTGKLDKYPFYPQNVINKKYLSVPNNIHNIIENYVDYQNKLSLETIISPNIFFDSFDSRMSQIALSLANEAINYTDKNLMISICVNEVAFKNFDDVQDFLDIISLFDVSGYYIIIERNLHSNNPNLIDSETLCNIMYFLYNLSEINMYKVILGYSDYLGILLYTTGIDAIATGWYENTRRFDRENFYQKTAMRRPNKRYFSNKIFNALLLTPEIQMIQDQGQIGKILSQSKYDHYMYNDLAGGEWSDSISCLSRWDSIKHILDGIDSKKNTLEKISFMQQNIIQAQKIYKDLPEEFFDTKSKSTHLESWLEGLNKFEDVIERM